LTCFAGEAALAAAMGANITAAPSKYIGLTNARLLICIPLTFFEDDLFDSRR
jgi:hypothetical protein